jgi:calcyclin binding protein
VVKMTTEIAETEALLRQATFPAVKTLLARHLESLQAAAAHSTASLATESKPTSLPTPPTAAASSANAGTPAAVNTSGAPSKRPKLAGTYIPVEDFAWDQGSYNSDTISIFVDLKGVGKVADNVHCDFTRMSFDLTVTDLDGKNYRLLKDNLEKDIVPAESKFVVKANKVVIKLKKVKGEYSYESWTNLTSKKKRDPMEEANKKKEPMGGIMDMMKDLYEDGDENMRKIIGEAMMKSQRGEKAEPPSMGDMDM